MDAVHDALQHAMEDDDSVWVLGIDVAEGGNVFGATRGLYAEFPGRVLDTPISETAIVGAAVGAAMAGSRPVAEVMYLDFVGVCFDQFMNQAAKMRFMTGGRSSLPLVVRTQFGAGRSSGAQHSQSLEALFAHIPGLTVCMPSTPADAYGLLRSAIDDLNPVVVIEHRLLYGWRGVRPPREHRVPIGKGVIRRQGRDVTVVSWSRAVQLALAAADTLAAEGIDVEVIDARTVAPLDLELIQASVRRTGRLVVAHEAVLTGGLGGEIVATVADACFWDLDAPVRRVTTEDLPAPYATAAEKEWLLDAGRVADVVRSVAEA
jgi:2-oxoisovalerate dehydrogenase E1 component